MEKTGKEGGRKHQAIVTPGAVVIPLDEQSSRKVHECIERSGEVKFSIEEVSVTKLTDIVDTVMVID